MYLTPEDVVVAVVEQRRREAEQYRLTHPELPGRPARRGRRSHGLHLPHLATLVHPGRRTPRMPG